MMYATAKYSMAGRSRAIYPLTLAGSLVIAVVTARTRSA